MATAFHDSADMPPELLARLLETRRLYELEVSEYSENNTENQRPSNVPKPKVTAAKKGRPSNLIYGNEINISDYEIALINQQLTNYNNETEIMKKSREAYRLLSFKEVYTQCNDEQRVIAKFVSQPDGFFLRRVRYLLWHLSC